MKLKAGWVIAGVASMLVIPVIVVMTTPPPSDPVDYEKKAAQEESDRKVDLCYRTASYLMKAPTTAKMQRGTDLHDQVVVDLTSENSFGVPLPSTAHCTMKEKDGSWSITKMEMGDHSYDEGELLMPSTNALLDQVRADRGGE